MLTNRNPQYTTSLIISPNPSNSLPQMGYLTSWLLTAGSGQEHDADMLLNIFEAISSEVTLRGGILLVLEYSSCTCGVDDVSCLCTGKEVLSGTGVVEPLVEGLSLCTDGDVRNLKPSGFTVKQNVFLTKQLYTLLVFYLSISVVKCNFKIPPL